MRAMILVLSPKESCDLLNGNLSVLARKKFPSDYVGWVYIYCTKSQYEELWWYDGTEDFRLYKKGIANEEDTGWHLQNGKVVARFWCDKVEELERTVYGYYKTNTITWSKIEDKICLRNKDLDIYFKAENHFGKVGYAIHITNLEIFDKPKEISKFEKLGSYLNPTIKCPKKDKGKCNLGISPFTNQWCGCEKAKLTRAPRSGWCYIDVDENN